MSSEGTSLLESAALPGSAPYGTYNGGRLNGLNSTDHLQEQSSDHEEQPAEVLNYRHVVLRWWFLTGLGVLFALFGGLIELAIHKLPVQDTGLTLFTRTYNGQVSAALDNKRATLMDYSPVKQTRPNFPNFHMGQAILAIPTPSSHVSIPREKPTTAVFDGFNVSILDLDLRTTSSSLSMDTSGEHVIQDTLTTVTAKKITLIRPSLLAETTEPPERPLRDFGHHLWALQPRIPSNSDFGSFGSVPVTFHSSRPATPTSLTTTPTLSKVTTPIISSPPSTLSEPSSTSDDQPHSTSTITISKSRSLSNSVPVIFHNSSSQSASPSHTSPTRTPTPVPLSANSTTSIPSNATVWQNTTTTPPGTPADDPFNFTENYFLSEADYFLGTFVGTLIATLLSIPIKMIDLNAQLLQPFHELASSGGTTASYSLCREAGSFHGMFQDIRLLFRGRWPLTLLTASMVLFSALTTTFSSEVFVLVLHGSCHHGSGSAQNCAWTIGVAVLGARITEAFLFFMALQIALTLLLLRNWHSGVKNNPWSIAGIASLLCHSDIREVLSALPKRGRELTNSAIQRELAPYTFKLEHFRSADRTQYGIVVCRQGELEVSEKHGPLFSPINHLKKLLNNIGLRRQASALRGTPQSFFALSITGRTIILAFLVGAIALIGYYNGPRTSQPFESFLDSESFGVRLLFTAIGVIITFAWDAFLTAVAHLSTYRRMARSPRTAQHSIAISPPTNSFSGFRSAILERDIFLGVVSVAGILSEFLPILLSNVPYQVTQTLDVHLVSTWISVGIMGVMVFIILGSFFVRWPPFPVDSRTIAGAAFYVCDSRLLHSMISSTVTRPQRPNENLSDPQEKYTFGEITGVSGMRRIGVDIDESLPITERDSLMRLYVRVGL
ncbi:hypothetical protein F4782DRAFT_476279 [Xylaria castorea]|nr:hypothetical protein F4782DRAFT_476279 [Xylaria castorea]